MINHGGTNCKGVTNCMISFGRSVAVFHSGKCVGVGIKLMVVIERDVNVKIKNTIRQLIEL